MTIVLVRSSNPCTLRLSRSASDCRSQSWYAGVLFLGTHAFWLDLPSDAFDLSVDKSTTLGLDEKSMTSLYSTLRSIARERTVGELRDGSQSEPSVSDMPDGSKGGVGYRLFGSGRGGSSWISLSRSWPLRYEFSIRKKRTAPRKDSS